MVLGSSPVAICPIFYFKQIISWRNTNKFRFIFVNTFVSKSLLKDEAVLKTLTFSRCVFICSNRFVPLVVNRFPNKLVPKVPHNIPKNLPFYSLASFLIIWFINTSDSWRDLTIFMITFISLLKIINVLVLDSNIFLRIATSVTGAAAVTPNGFKTLLANGFHTFQIKAIQFLVTVLKVYLTTLLSVLFYAIEFLIILY